MQLNATHMDWFHSIPSYCPLEKNTNRPITSIPNPMKQSNIRKDWLHSAPSCSPPDSNTQIDCLHSSQSTFLADTTHLLLPHTEHLLLPHTEQSYPIVKTTHVHYFQQTIPNVPFQQIKVKKQNKKTNKNNSPL